MKASTVCEIQLLAVVALCRLQAMVVVTIIQMNHRKMVLIKMSLLNITVLVFVIALLVIHQYVV
jgi:hypothetical protein